MFLADGYASRFAAPFASSRSIIVRGLGGGLEGFGEGWEVRGFDDGDAPGEFGAAPSDSQTLENFLRCDGCGVILFQLLGTGWAGKVVVV